MAFGRCVCCSKVKFNNKENICKKCSEEFNQLLQAYIKVKENMASLNYDNILLENEIKDLILDLGKFKYIEKPFDIDSCLSMLKELSKKGNIMNIHMLKEVEVKAIEEVVEEFKENVEAIEEKAEVIHEKVESIEEKVEVINREDKEKYEVIEEVKIEKNIEKNIDKKVVENFQNTSFFNNDVLISQNKVFNEEKIEETKNDDLKKVNIRAEYIKKEVPKVCFNSVVIKKE